MNNQVFYKMHQFVILYQSRYLEYRIMMDILSKENAQSSQKQPKQFTRTMKSVCRLMPIDAQQSDDLMKQQQIDEIRKKLKIINNINQKNRNASNDKVATDQTQVKALQKTGSMLKILLGKSRQKDQILKRSIDNKVNKQNQLADMKQLIKPDAFAITQHRKIKTECREFIFDISSKTKSNSNFNINTKQPDSNMQCLKVNTQNKQQKYIVNRKLWSNFKINEHLQNLKYQLSNQTTQSHEILSSKQPSNQELYSSQTQVKKQNRRRVLSRKVSIVPIYKSNSDKIIEEKQQKLKQVTLTQTQADSVPSNSTISTSFRFKNLKKLSVITSSNKTVKKESNRSNYQQFITFVKYSLGLIPDQNSNSAPVWKFYIVKGNNQELIRRLLRRRKWVQANKMQQANLVWSQKRQDSCYRLMDKVQFEKQEHQICNKSTKFQIKCECDLTKQCQCNLSKLLLDKSPNCEQLGCSIQKNKKYNTTQVTFMENSLYKLKENGNFYRSHNHLSHNYEIAYKKLLFTNLKNYYISKRQNPFDHIPHTFHINSFRDPAWNEFLRQFRSRAHKKQPNLWIIKPGQNTNRGTGIKVQQQLQDIRQQVTQMLSEDDTSVIIQHYIMPLLYNKRKFDIRCYVLTTVVNGQFRAYWYQEGYIRTSCKQFNIHNLGNKFVHLTNDAVQKTSQDYGKYQPGNKISFQILYKYIQTNCNQHGITFQKNIYSQMIKLSKDAFQSAYEKLHQNNKDFCFQIFGLDFLVDQNYKTWLIEVNRNPCLETSTLLLNRIISQMLQNAFKIAIDPLFWPHHAVFDMEKSNRFENKFKLIVSKPLVNSSNFVDSTD